MHTSHKLFMIAACLFLSSCRATAPPLPPVAMPTSTLAATEVSVSTAEPDSPLPTPAIAPTPAAFAPDPVLAVPEPQFRTEIRLDALVDFAAGTVAVSQSLQFAGPTREEAASVILIADVQRLPEVFLLETLRWGTGEPVNDWRLEDGILEIAVPPETDAGEPLALELDYFLQLPAVRGKTSFFAGQLNLGDWYVMPAVYDTNRGWLAHNPGPVGETLVYGMADYEVRLRVKNAPEGLVIAASGHCVEAAGERVCSGKALRNFALSMSPDYEVLEAQAGEVRVISYFFPEEAAAGEMALEAAVRSIEVFSELFGPYPHPVYSVLPANFPDGLEFDGLTYVGREYYGWFEGGITNYLYLLIVHEAAHQWWYARVGNDQAYEPWLDEALATYSELLYLESYHPELQDWWWGFRIDFFRPFDGNVNDPVYAYQGFRPYVNSVYLRGAEMLEEIRAAMGDEAFLAALQDYADDHSGRLATGADLIAAFENRSESDLSPIFESYFYVP